MLYQQQIPSFLDYVCVAGLTQWIAADLLIKEHLDLLVEAHQIHLSHLC